MSNASRDKSTPAFNVKNVKLSYLDHGDRLNLQTRAVTPAKHKLQGRKIDPFAPDFNPDSDEDQFETNILGNTTIANVMTQLIWNRQSQAVGLAFDGLKSRIGPTSGFEFRFYRERDSLGWYSDAEGDDAFTVINIHLDIRPVQVALNAFRAEAGTSYHLLMAAAAFVVGVGAASGTAAGPPASLGSAMALLTLGVAAAVRPDPVRRGLAAVMFVAGAELVRVAIAGNPSPLEAAVAAALGVVLCTCVALLAGTVQGRPDTELE
jgi:hypothetical protein